MTELKLQLAGCNELAIYKYDRGFDSGKEIKTKKIGPVYISLRGPDPTFLRCTWH